MHLARSNRQGKVCAFPSLLLRPIKREYNFAARLQAARRQISEVDAKAAILGLRILRRFPAVAAPVDHGRREHLDAYVAVERDRSAFIVEAPTRISGFPLLQGVALEGLRRLVEDLSILERAHQFDVFRV